MTEDAKAGSGDVTSAIANRVVHLHKELFGRGPTRARAHWHDDVITVVLREGFTQAEHSLLDAGRDQAVIDQRAEMQDAVRDRFIDEIGAIVGRRVVGYVSGIQTRPPQLVVDVFVLERPEDPADHADAGYEPQPPERSPR